MSNGSRWYFPVYEGLVDEKHQAQMGPAIWLYLYCIKYAMVHNPEDGVFEYSHIEAAAELGMSTRNVKRWLDTLQQYGYVKSRARKRHCLELAVSNWRTVAEWVAARKRLGEVTNLSLDNKQEVTDLSRSDMRSDMRSDRIVPPYIIAISLDPYIYPTGSDELANQSISDVFRNLISELKTTKNRAATLRMIYRLCFGGAEENLPEYSYIGKVAKQVGGAERLAQLMWELTARPPADPLSYIQAMQKQKGKQNATNQRPPQQKQSVAKIEDFQ
jgi:hypothetical protein